MGGRKLARLGAVFFVVLLGVSVHARAAERIRGTIASVDGSVLHVVTRDGADAQLNLADNTTVSELVASRMSDIKSGTFVGVTAVPGTSKDTLIAREVHIFAPAQRGTGEGHYDWDLEPGSTMTNADVVATVDFRKGKELVLKYKGGSQRIMVPIGVPIVMITPADKSLIKRGAHVFITATRADDGSLTAQRIAVGTDGMEPPM